MGRAFEFRKARKMKRWSAMSKAFTRIGKDIVMAVKEGGPDPDSNSRLRAVIQNAKSINMPKDNIERAIKRASDKNQGDYKGDIAIAQYIDSDGIIVMITLTIDSNDNLLDLDFWKVNFEKLEKYPKPEELVFENFKEIK